MKRTIGWTAHALCLATVLLAIWSPVGSWWQWAATAVLLLLLGAVLLGQPTRPQEDQMSVSYSDRVPEHERVPLRDGEVLSGTGDEELDRKLNARPKYGKRAE